MYAREGSTFQILIGVGAVLLSLSGCNKGPSSPGASTNNEGGESSGGDRVAPTGAVHKSGGDTVGSLLLGLYDASGRLQHVGVTSSFTMTTRKALAKELEPLRQNALDDHPWREWAAESAAMTRMPGGQSRWSAGKDLSWEPLRIERVCEVKYDHLQGDRFRHATAFLRWRPEKRPAECRYDQLEVTPAYELEKVFGAGRS